MSKQITQARLSRRAFLEASALAAGAMAATPLVAGAASRPSAAKGARIAAQDGAVVSDFGVTLPADAAPKEFQFVQTSQPSSGLGWKSMDPLESIYSSFPGYANLSEGLVRVDKDWQVVPGQATEWAVSDDGMSWTFKLDPSLMWSDDTPLTADDYVATFRYAADPAHAWDFTWFFDGIIKNWKEVIAGSVPVD